MDKNAKVAGKSFSPYPRPMKRVSLSIVVILALLIAEASGAYLSLKDSFGFSDSLSDSIWRAIVSFPLSLPFALYALPSTIGHFPIWPGFAGSNGILLAFTGLYWLALVFMFWKARRSPRQRELLVAIFIVLALSAPLWFFCVSEITHV